MFIVETTNNKGDSENIDKHPILVEFGDVFLEEFPRIPQKVRLISLLTLNQEKDLLKRKAS